MDKTLGGCMAVFGRALFGTGRGLIALGDGALSTSDTSLEIFEFSDFRDGRHTTLTSDGLEFIRPVAGSNLALLLVGEIYPAIDASGRQGFIGVAALCEANGESIRQAQEEFHRQEWMDALTEGHQILASGEPLPINLLPPALQPFLIDPSPNSKVKRFSAERIGYYSFEGRFLPQADDRDLDLICRRLHLATGTILTLVFSDRPRHGHLPWDDESIGKMEAELRLAKTNQSHTKNKVSRARNAVVDTDNLDARLRRIEARTRSLDARVHGIEVKIRKVRTISEIVILGAVVAVIIFLLFALGHLLWDLVVELGKPQRGYEQ